MVRSSESLQDEAVEIELNVDLRLWQSYLTVDEKLSMPPNQVYTLCFGGCGEPVRPVTTARPPKKS